MLTSPQVVFNQMPMSRGRMSEQNEHIYEEILLKTASPALYYKPRASTVSVHTAVSTPGPCLRGDRTPEHLTQRATVAARRLDLLSRGEDKTSFRARTASVSSYFLRPRPPPSSARVLARPRMEDTEQFWAKYRRRGPATSTTLGGIMRSILPSSLAKRTSTIQF